MFDKLPLSGLDPYAPLTVPLWAAGAAAALLLLFLLIALFRGGFGAVIGGLVRIVLLALAMVGAWMLFNWVQERDHIEARRSLDQRLDELTARVLAPTSVLGCLEPGLGDAIDNSCEKELFASPETIGAATALVAARWSLLGRAVDHAKRDPGYDARLDGLRRTLQADRYGFLAQVLSTREGCTASRCEGLERLSDPTRVRANLAERTFESLVARNAVAWANRVRVPTAAAAPVPNPNVNFPSASSIPPVSIMNTEPGAGAPAAAAPTPPRRAPPPPKAAPRPAAKRAPAAPADTGTAAAPDQQ
jgi:cell division septation protein DedD